MIDLPHEIIIKGSFEFASSKSEKSVDGWIATHSLLHEYDFIDGVRAQLTIYKVSDDECYFAYKFNTSTVRINGVTLSYSGKFWECVKGLKESLAQL